MEEFDNPGPWCCCADSYPAPCCDPGPRIPRTTSRRPQDGGGPVRGTFFILCLADSCSYIFQLLIFIKNRLIGLRPGSGMAYSCYLRIAYFVIVRLEWTIKCTVIIQKISQFYQRFCNRRDYVKECRVNLLEPLLAEGGSYSHRRQTRLQDPPSRSPTDPAFNA